MNKYDSMSDKEIAEAVLLADGWENDDSFDPCNNPSDAYPIMLENKIGFHFVNNKWSALSLERGYHEYSSSNPLRSVMIVFLMMQDSENV